MATTRYYFDQTAGGVTPASWNPNWDKTSGTAGTRTLSLTKVSANAQVEANNTINVIDAESFTAWARFVSDALSAGTISGSVRGVVKCRENTAVLDASLALAIKVIQSDGSDRGTLLDLTAVPLANGQSGLPEFDPVVFSAANTRRFQDASSNTDILLTPVAAQTNDRLVVEIGFRAFGNSTFNNASLAYGTDTGGGDHAHGEGSSANLNGWIEFTSPADEQAWRSTKRRHDLSRFNQSIWSQDKAIIH